MLMLSCRQVAIAVLLIGGPAAATVCTDSPMVVTDGVQTVGGNSVIKVSTSGGISCSLLTLAGTSLPGGGMEMALSHIYSLDSVPVAISQIEDYSSEGYYQFVTSSDTSSFSPPGELWLGSAAPGASGTVDCTEGPMSVAIGDSQGGSHGLMVIVDGSPSAKINCQLLQSDGETVLAGATEIEAILSLKSYPAGSTPVVIHGIEDVGGVVYYITLEGGGTPPCVSESGCSRDGMQLALLSHPPSPPPGSPSPPSPPHFPPNSPGETCTEAPVTVAYGTCDGGECVQPSETIIYIDRIPCSVAEACGWEPPYEGTMTSGSPGTWCEALLQTNVTVGGETRGPGSISVENPMIADDFPVRLSIGSEGNHGYDHVGPLENDHAAGEPVIFSLPSTGTLPIDPPDGTSLPPPSPLPPGDVNHLFNSEGSRCSTWYSQECSESEGQDQTHVTTLVGCMQQCALFVTFGACDWALFNMAGEDENCHMFTGSFTMEDHRDTCSEKGQPILKPSQWTGNPCPETDVDTGLCVQGGEMKYAAP